MKQSEKVRTALEAEQPKLQLAEAKLAEAQNTIEAVERERAAVVVAAEDGDAKAQKLMADSAQKLDKLDRLKKDAAALVAGRKVRIEQLRQELLQAIEADRKLDEAQFAAEVDAAREALAVALGPVVEAAQLLDAASKQLAAVSGSRVQAAEQYLAALLVGAGIADTRMFLADRRLLVTQDGRSIAAPQRPSTAEQAA